MKGALTGLWRVIDIRTLWPVSSSKPSRSCFYLLSAATSRNPSCQSGVKILLGEEIVAEHNMNRKEQKGQIYLEV
jgi:hypothetical protein